MAFIIAMKVAMDHHFKITTSSTICVYAGPLGNRWATKSNVDQQKRVWRNAIFFSKASIMAFITAIKTTVDHHQKTTSSSTICVDAGPLACCWATNENVKLINLTKKSVARRPFFISVNISVHHFFKNCCWSTLKDAHGFNGFDDKICYKVTDKRCAGTQRVQGCRVEILSSSKHTGTLQESSPQNFNPRPLSVTAQCPMQYQFLSIFKKMLPNVRVNFNSTS